MKKTKKLMRNKPHFFIGIPAALSFVSFISNVVEAFEDGHLSGAELSNLMSSAEGFESVSLMIIMIILRKRNK